MKRKKGCSLVRSSFEDETEFPGKGLGYAFCRLCVLIKREQTGFMALLLAPTNLCFYEMESENCVIQRGVLSNFCPCSDSYFVFRFLRFEGDAAFTLENKQSSLFAAKCSFTFASLGFWKFPKGKGPALKPRNRSRSEFWDIVTGWKLGSRTVAKEEKWQFCEFAGIAKKFLNPQSGSIQINPLFCYSLVRSFLMF